MNALYTATRFQQPMERGVNRPMLIQGESQEDGKRTDIVLKCKAGYADAPECLLREHVAYQLARRLGITTPEPVWVYVPEGLSWSAAEYETHRELLERSVGWNFGTIHLGNEWKPWISRNAEKFDAERLGDFAQLRQENSARFLGKCLCFRCHGAKCGSARR